MMLIVAAILQQLQHQNWLKGFVTGMSPAVAALIVTVAWELFPAHSIRKVGRRTLLIAVLSAAALGFNIPSPIVLLGAGILGVILYGQRSL